MSAFDAEYAYTMDGGPLGGLEYESFNAASAFITCKGKNVHPSTAKGKMVNAAKIAMELHGRLPADETPEKTEGYEGFYHLSSIYSTDSRWYGWLPTFIYDQGFGFPPFDSYNNDYKQ